MNLQLLTLPKVLLLGCSPANSLIVGPSSPKPRILQKVLPAISSLEISDEIRDSFVLPASDGAPTARMQGWRQTLRRGFESALAGTETSGGSLVIEQATLGFVRKSRMAGKIAYASLDDEQILLAHGGLHAPTPRRPPRVLYARLEFSVRYVEPPGTKCTVSGTVLSSSSIGSKTSATAAARSAVEVMFEQIAADLSRSAQPER